MPWQCQQQQLSLETVSRVRADMAPTSPPVYLRCMALISLGLNLSSMVEKAGMRGTWIRDNRRKLHLGVVLWAKSQNLDCLFNTYKSSENKSFVDYMCLSTCLYSVVYLFPFNGILWWTKVLNVNTVKIYQSFPLLVFVCPVYCLSLHWDQENIPLSDPC